MRKHLYLVMAMVMIASVVLVSVGLAMAQEQPPNEVPLEVYTGGYPPDFSGLTLTLVGDAGHKLKPYQFWKEDFARKEKVMNGDSQFLGIVRNGEFQLLLPEPGPLGRSVRLTSIAMQEARSPESGELDLSAYEGSAIMVQGHDGGGWIYSARVIEQAGPILTAVVQHVFGPESWDDSES